MIGSSSISTHSKYRSWLAYFVLVLAIGIPILRAQASPFSFYAGRSEKHHAGMVSPGREDQQARQLEPGKPIERELAGGQSHSYQMTLIAGQYVKLIVRQRGIDVVARLFGSDGKQFAEFDSEIRTQGEETVSWVSEEAGNYRVDLLSKYKYPAAGRYEIQVIELRSTTENDRALHEARKLYTEFHSTYRAGKYNEALALAERVLAIREELLGPEHHEVVDAINNRAILYAEMGRYDKAEPMFQQVITIREKTLGPEHPALGLALNNLANSYRQRVDYVKAEANFMRALAIFEKALGAEHILCAMVFVNLGYVFEGRANYSKAEAYYLRGLAIMEKILGPDDIYLSTTLNNLAVVYITRGDLRTAESYLERVLAIRERALRPEHPDIAQALNNLGLLYKDRGNYAKSESFYGRALAILMKVFGPHHTKVAQLLGNQADLYRERGDYGKAEPLYVRALAIREKALGTEHPDVAMTLNALANLYRETGNYAMAEKLCGRALVSLEKALGPDHLAVAHTLRNLANLYRDDKGDYAKAETLYGRAWVILEKTLEPDDIDVTSYFGNLAILYRKRGDYAKAEPLYQRTVASVEKMFGPEHPDTAEVLNDFAKLYAAKGDIAQAITVLTRANAIDERILALSLSIGSERQKLAYLNTFARRTDMTLSLHSQAALQYPHALELAFTTLLRRKARGLDAMADTISTLRRHATPENRTLLDRLVEVRSQLAALTLKEHDEAKPEIYRKRLDPLREKVEELEAELSSRSAEFRDQRRPVTLSSIQAALPEESALIEFACFTPLDPKTEKSEPPRYLAYLLPAQGRPRWVDLGEAAPIDQAIDAWRKALRNPNRLDVKRLARAVDEKVMRPVRSLLGEMAVDTRRLLIAPDGSLNLIPFAALVDEQNQYLIESYSITYLTSGRDLLRPQTSESSKSPPLVVANPDFGNPATIAMRGVTRSGKGRARIETQLQVDPTQLYFQPLPASRYEALAIKSILPQALVLQQEQASETALKGARGPQILHIATHGFFYNNKQDRKESPSAEEEAARVDSPGTPGLASAPAPSYTVQLEAIPELETAEERAKQLRAQGMDVYIVKSKVKGKGIFYRVRAGNFPTHAEAQRYGADLQGKGIVSEFFVAGYRPSQGGLAEAGPMIGDLRLSKFVAKVKDPLLRSGLALAGANQGKSGDDDGVLTAMEAAYLDLSGTKLVVLSACNTGVGDVRNGEGVQGLRRALVLAGSESQVMSLWPVADVAAKDLMIPYYKALQEGEGRSEGLRQVQLRMLHGRKDRQHPFYWAAFIQSGEWANLDGQR
jgi:CHAT domain-containing protein/Tfp pilus assembly protein PilF